MKDALYLSDRNISEKIFFIRGMKVMMDNDLAELYGTETKQLKRQVRRNLERFPEDFMFELTEEELEILRCQTGTSRWGGSRYIPMAFTEQGVAMLSSVLSSPKAIAVNIQIIRVFTRMREIMMGQKELIIKLEKLEQKMMKQDEYNSRMEKEVKAIFDALRKLFVQESAPRRKIGYRRSE